MSDSLHPSERPELSLDARMTALARTFPTLADAPGVQPWDPKRLAEQLAKPWPGTGARHALKFVLSVWSPPRDEQRFDVMGALGAWDSTHREAFLAWAARPWWP